MNPIPSAHLICISNFPVTTYSGMFPGVLAGQYEPNAMQIDLVRLCASARVRLIIGEVTGVDREQQQILFKDRPSLRYDALSIGIGSRPLTDGVAFHADNVLPIKPMQTALQRLEDKLTAYRTSTDVLPHRKRIDHSKDSTNSPVKPLNVAVVGGGIGSIEIAFCLERRLRDQSMAANLSLICGSDRPGSGLPEKTSRLIRTSLEQRGIACLSGQRVTSVDERSVTLADQSKINADVVLWATGAVASPLLGQLDLEKDRRGFLLTRPTLQTVSDDRIFAVGDSGTLKDNPTDKAGVYAVRQGPVLWGNLQNFVQNEPLESYRPQRNYLKLINTADGKSIAEYRGVTVKNRAAWWMKDRIDRRFMAKYQDYSVAMMASPTMEAEDAAAMRCLGCGGKIGGRLLSEVIGELEIGDHRAVVVGLEHPDDAAVIRTTENRVAATTDFFASPLDDPWLVGRIALLNSASDCFVMGAQPTGVLAIVQLPQVHQRAQLQIMRELMAGANEEIRRMGGVLVGGHSIEGPRLTIGFTVLGDPVGQPNQKGTLRPGDALILTRPLGTGVLLAALMQARLSGQHYQSLVRSITQSNAIALELVKQPGVSALTDVTGFGLAGHMTEMLQASGVSAQLRLDDIARLPGCDELIREGVASTLLEENRLMLSEVLLEGNRWESAEAAVLLDPQTGGGILCGCEKENADAAVKFLQDNGFQATSIIGEVIDNTGGRCRMKLV